MYSSELGIRAYYIGTVLRQSSRGLEAKVFKMWYKGYRGSKKFCAILMRSARALNLGIGYTRARRRTNPASGTSVVTDERSEDDTSEARSSVASASNASVVVVVTVVRAKRGRFVVVIIMRA